MSAMTKLTLTMFGGKNLTNVRKEGKCDPFVEIRIGRNILRTKHAHQTQDPVWNEVFKINPGEWREIALHVVDKGVQYVPMGQGMLFLDDVVIGKMHLGPTDESVPLKLKGNAAGSLKVILAAEFAAMNEGQESLKAALSQQQSVSMVRHPTDSAPPSRKSSAHGTLHGAKGKHSAMHRLDAADGKIDGKYFGHTIDPHDHSHHHAHGEGGQPAAEDDLIRQCGLKDPEHPERVCHQPCHGSVAHRRHQAECPFQRQTCPSDKCGAVVSRRNLNSHLETCKHFRIQCVMCQARYYRMDADYHHSICPLAQIKCPLSCGLVLPRGELLHHIETDYMRHSHEVLESQDYLPGDHPARVYGQMLRRLKDLRVRVELARKPGILITHDQDLSPIYTPSKVSFPGGAPQALFVQSKWLKRYDKAMEDLTNPATRPRAETEADELIADMEDVLDYEEGQPSTLEVKVGDAKMTLGELSSLLENLRRQLKGGDPRTVSAANLATTVSFQFEEVEDF